VALSIVLEVRGGNGLDTMALKGLPFTMHGVIRCVSVFILLSMLILSRRVVDRKRVIQCYGLKAIDRINHRLCL
jgi:hypothetical protein